MQKKIVSILGKRVYRDDGSSEIEDLADDFSPEEIKFLKKCKVHARTLQEEIRKTVKRLARKGLTPYSIQLGLHNLSATLGFDGHGNLRSATLCFDGHGNLAEILHHTYDWSTRYVLVDEDDVIEESSEKR